MNGAARGVDISRLAAPNARVIHYQALDGLRGLAILLVFICHVYTATHYFRTSSLGRVLDLGVGGWVGVDLFFVLSGFLITGILIKTVDGPKYFKNFYIRRALRILPLSYGVFLLLVLLTPILHLEWNPWHIAYLFYFQNIVQTFVPGLIWVPPAIQLAHFWSLAVEEQYYMIWPLAIWVLRDERKIMRLCLMLIACCILLRIALIALLPIHMAIDLVYRELPSHGDGLLLGSWLALAMRRWPVELLRRHAQWPAWLAAAAFVSVAIYAHSLNFDSAPMEIVGLTALPIVFANLLLKCFIPGSWEVRFFSLPFMRFLGRYSYGIYVYHLLFMPVMIQGLRWLQAHLHSRVIAGLVFLLLWILGTIAVAVLSYKYFESPFLRLKERFAPMIETLAKPLIDQTPQIHEQMPHVWHSKLPEEP
jgi:peptidoglycan/LPS O-acetylase OafA/YrhL